MIEVVTAPAIDLSTLVLDNNNIKDLASETKELIVDLDVVKNKSNSLSLEIVKRLYVAREYYYNAGFRSDLVQRCTRLETFENFIEFIGLKKRTSYNFLERYNNETGDFISNKDLTEKKQKIKEDVSDYYYSKEKRDDWSEEHDVVFDKYKKGMDKLVNQSNNKDELAEVKVLAEESKATSRKLKDILDKEEDNFDDFGSMQSELELFRVINSMMIKLSDNEQLSVWHNLIKECKSNINRLQVKSQE